MNYPTTIFGTPTIAARLLQAKATALREYAERHHRKDPDLPPIQVVDESPVLRCACWAPWDTDEGCRERRQLLADAQKIERGETP